jgi:hypothetical protein
MHSAHAVNFSQNAEVGTAFSELPGRCGAPKHFTSQEEKSTGSSIYQQHVSLKAKVCSPPSPLSSHHRTGAIDEHTSSFVLWQREKSRLSSWLSWAEEFRVLCCALPGGREAALTEQPAGQPGKGSRDFVALPRSSLFFASETEPT